MTEDAIAEDRYSLDRRGRITGMRRTGHYIESPWATFVYVPDEAGRLQLDEASRRIVERMDAAGQLTYIQDWPTYSSRLEFPFISSIRGSQGKARVTPGCPEATPLPSAPPD